MKTSDPQYGTTSARSLIAMTAGAASAALLIMFIGLFVTAISIGATTTVEIHAAVHQSNVGAMVMAQA